MQCTDAGKPAALCKFGAPEITYGHAIRTNQRIFIKTNCLTFYHPKYENCKPEHAEKGSYCIAMHNENKANCNENFRICAEEPVAPL